MDDNNAGSFVGVLVVGGIVMVILAISLGRYPGKLAAKRNHPNAAAIMMLGQLGILSFGILWFVALVWAQSNFTTAGMVQGGLPSVSCLQGADHREGEQLQALRRGPLRRRTCNRVRTAGVLRGAATSTSGR